MAKKRYGKSAGGLSLDPEQVTQITVDVMERDRLRRREELRAELHELWPSFFPLKTVQEATKSKPKTTKRKAAKP